MVAQAVILAGGRGTRLGDLTQNTPKPMVNVAGQPFLYWQLCYLRDHGVREALLLTGYLGEQIAEHFRRQPVPGLKLSFHAESSPLGTGGALVAARELLASEFYLLNGDSFLCADLEALADARRRSNWEAVLCVAEAGGVVPSNLQIDARGYVLRYQKNGGAGYTHVDAGLVLLTRECLAGKHTPPFDVSHFWPNLITRRTLGTYLAEEPFYDIGTPERLRTFEEHLHDYFPNALSN